MKFPFLLELWNQLEEILENCKIKEEVEMLKLIQLELDEYMSKEYLYKSKIEAVEGFKNEDRE